MRLTRALAAGCAGLAVVAVGLWLVVGNSAGDVDSAEPNGSGLRAPTAPPSVISGCVSPPSVEDGTTVLDRIHFYDNGIDQGDKVQSDGRADGSRSTKQGLVIEGAGTVVLRIPASARPSVVISAWGTNNGNETMRVARIRHEEPPCSGNKWAAYAGGFDFRGKQCLRLRVEADGHSAKVPFGLGKSCD